MLVRNKDLFRLVIVAVVTGALIVNLGTTRATLVFEDDRPLKLTWEQAEAGVDVVVCNMGNVSLQFLQATLTGFNFRVGEKVVSLETVLKPISINSTLVGRVCTHVLIQAADGPTPDLGEYKGLLVLADLGTGEIIRREVTIELLPVERAVDDIVLTAIRGSQSLDTPYLPLKPSGPGVTLNLPENGTHIGIVYNEGHIGNVFVNGEPDKSQKGVVLLPIRIEGLDAVGTYSGKLYLAGTGDDKGAIPVKVKVTDNIGWAILAILIGFVISLFPVMLLLEEPKFGRELGVIFLAIIVAVLTGLTQFYFGKTFGTWGDYLYLVLLGAGTHVAVKSTQSATVRLKESWAVKHFEYEKLRTAKMIEIEELRKKIEELEKRDTQ
jgi:hypothetical protein